MKRLFFVTAALLLLAAEPARAGPTGGPVTKTVPAGPTIQIEPRVRLESGQTFVNQGFGVAAGCCFCGSQVSMHFGGSSHTMLSELRGGVSITFDEPITRKEVSDAW